MITDQDMDDQFKNPILQINIETGEGYCRIDELWKKEGVIIIDEAVSTKKKSEGDKVWKSYEKAIG